MGRSLVLPLDGQPPAAPAGRSVALFAKGFRPFFLLGALSAATMVPLWLGVLSGEVHPASHFAPIHWHAHEMVFGFTVAVIAGFLLTAVGNWTKRETAVGVPLGLLCLLWCAGRLAMSTTLFSPSVTAALDLAFLPALAIVLARPLLATNNRRNVVMLGVLVALFGANAMTHLGAVGRAPEWDRRGALVAIDVVIVLLLIMVGRVLPMFTRNATKSEGVRSHPALDTLAIAMMAALAAINAFAAPLAPLVNASLATVVAALTLARAAHWGTSKTFGQPLLWILHLGYAWIPAALVLRALGDVAGGVFPQMATHALTAGAIGTLTLGMMARVALGHTGRPLGASRPIVVSFVLVTLAALARVLAPLAPTHYLTALVLAGGLWASAFILYLLVYAPILASPRVDGRAG